jgi:CxxC motif-containing protein
MIITKLSSDDVKNINKYIKNRKSKKELNLVVLLEEKEKKKIVKKDKNQEDLDKFEVTEYTCVQCPEGCLLKVYHEGKNIKKVTGNLCGKGITYAHQEHSDPRRVFSTTVLADYGLEPRVVPVKLTKPLPKDVLIEAAKEIHKIKITSPKKFGEIIAKDIGGEKGVNLIVCRAVTKDKN